MVYRSPGGLPGRPAVWRHMSDELSALVGPDVFALLVPYLEGREKGVALSPTPPPGPTIKASQLVSVGRHERQGTLEVDA